MAEEQKSVIISLDIGTSSVKVIVAELDEAQAMKIIGVGCEPSLGLKQGMVVDIESTVGSIKSAVTEAELMSGIKIDNVVAGISGHHIHSINSNGVVAIAGKEVTQMDIDRAMDAAKAVSISHDQQILHVLPQDYIIDGQQGIRDPIGMVGVRLEVNVHIIVGLNNVAQNIETCINRCGLTLNALIANQVASSGAALSADEKDLGVCVMDIGGGTIDLQVYKNGAIQHTSVVPQGGNEITSDIAVGFSTPMKEAEELKVRYACAVANSVDPAEMIKVPSIGERAPRDLSRQQLADAVQSRFETMFTLVNHNLDYAGVDRNLAAGIVITGGSGLMEGAVDLVEALFGMPVRLAKPRLEAADSRMVDDPVFVTSMGLLNYSREYQLVPKTKLKKSHEEAWYVRFWHWLQSVNSVG